MVTTPQAEWIVIGSAGLIGSRVRRRLAEARVPVRGLDIVPHPGGEELDFYATDFADVITRSTQVVLVCASQFFARDTRLSVTRMSRELSAFRRLYEAAARSSGETTVVFPSSGGTVYGNQRRQPIPETAELAPLTAYGASKVMIEAQLSLLASQTRVRTVVLRISNAYGPGHVEVGRQGLIGTLRTCLAGGEPFSLWNEGREVRDYIWLGDIAEAILLAPASQGPFEVFNVGTGVGTSTAEVVGLFQRLSKRRLEIVRRSAFETGIARNVLDPGKIQRQLGWRARVSLEQGVRQLVEDGG